MEYLVHLLIIVSIYAILAVSLNLVVGFAGLLSVTHAGFYGIGAYASAVLLTKQGLSFWSALGCAMLITMVSAYLIGLVTSKLKGDLYALATIGFNSIVFTILLNWESVTRGPLGIPGIPRPALGGSVFTDNVDYLFLCVILLVIVYGISHFITTSAFGRALKAIREDELASQVFGYNTNYFKLTIFTISAGLAAVAGALYASYISYIDPSTFTILESVFLLAMIILGGLANLKGSLLGAIFLVLLPEALRFVGFPTEIAAQMRQVVYGLLLILLMLYRPQGLFGEYKL